ncbi:hypothetical protein HK101_011243 [Irineochytrium annulatum]|nr:hypothetical protein HK101_011243 [Irineochytrium annulatum]
MAVLHFQWGYIRPLLLQSVLSLRTVSSTPLFQVHVLGKPATGDLKRPWKGNMFGPAATEAPTPKEAKAQEKKAEKKKLIKKRD